MKFLFFSITICFAVLNVFAQDNPLWLRYPAISPDGENIVFNYQGDIYKVATKGGQAIALTTHQAHDFRPVWSHDGQSIAFASNRYGNYDIFIMPAEGGVAKRLTYHSANDLPESFTPDDKTVLFTSLRQDDVNSAQFPNGRLTELYSIGLDGYLTQVLTTTSENAVWNKDKTKLLYHDKKGYEDEWRKHHSSAITRDIWVYDVADKTHTKITTLSCEDRNPVWSNDELSMYYLSEEKGSFNVWKTSLSDFSKRKQLTVHTDFPVRFLTKSNTNILCYSYNGELYTLKEGAAPMKLNISIKNDNQFNEVVNLNVKGEVSEMVSSPSGKEIAFIARGEIFVTSTEYKTTKRITNTPEQERSVSFSKDGNTLLYASERDGSWNIYQTKRVRKEESYFFNATILEETALVKTDKVTFQPLFSPDGKYVAFIEDRTSIKIMDLKSKAVKTILPAEKYYSYSDGDLYYEWSPDSKWIATQFLPYYRWNADIAVINVETTEIHNVTESGYDMMNPKWMMGGKLLIWFSARHAMANKGGHGSQSDVYGLFLNDEAFERFKMNKEAYELLKEQEEKDKKLDKNKNKDDNEEKEDDKVEDLVFNFNQLDKKTLRLTINSSFLADAIVNKEGTVMYYMSKFEKDYDIWKHDFKEQSTTLFAKINSTNASLQFDKGEKHLLVLANNKITKINVASKKQTVVKYDANMLYNPAEERAYIFNHAWKQVKDKFYKKDLHGVDWDGYKISYNKYLAHINNGADFAEMLGELLGELNASHTGARYYGKMANADKTASLAVYYDYNYTGGGAKIAEILPTSPLDKIDSKVKVGDVIKKIDGVEIKYLSDLYANLNRKHFSNTLLTVYNPKTKKTFEQIVKPINISTTFNLMYERWVRNREELVEKLSGGKIGYVHVKGMNNASYRVVYEKMLGKYQDTKAMIVDTRFNGGGWLHDALATLLDGKAYATFIPRGQKVGVEPAEKWNKPSAILISEGNYSDAHGFPFAYRSLGIGKAIGMPVPGTMTAVWWEKQINRSIVFGIPQVGVMDNKGVLQENTQFEPDIKVNNEYAELAKGKDQQLEKAVEVLMGE